MALDKNELRYLISELKKYFVVKSDIGDLGGSGVTEDMLDELKGEIEEFVENKNYVTQEHVEEQIQDIEEMLGGKAIRYITQEEFDVLSEEEKLNPEISWVITDKPEIDVSMLHNHDNMEVLKNITQEQIDAWNNGSDIVIPDDIITEEDLQPIISDVELLKTAVEKPPTYVMPTLVMNIFPLDIPLNEESEIKISFKFNKNDAGNINNVILKRNGIIISEGEIISEFTDIITASDANSIRYNLTVMYDEGVVKNSNLGNPYPNTNIKAGELVVEKSVSVFAPSYYGAVKTFDISLLNIINNTSRDCTFTSIFLEDEKFVYMYPSNFGELQSIKDANNFEYIDSYTKEHVTYNGIDYLVYILTDAVTISDFKQVFS